MDTPAEALIGEGADGGETAAQINAERKDAVGCRALGGREVVGEEGVGGGATKSLPKAEAEAHEQKLPEAVDEAWRKCQQAESS